METKYPIEVKAKPTNETNESSSNEKEVDPKPSAPKKQTDIESSVFESHLLFDPKIIHNFKSMRAELFLLNKLSRQILSPHFNIKTGSLVKNQNLNFNTKKLNTKENFLLIILNLFSI